MALSGSGTGRRYFLIVARSWTSGTRSSTPGSSLACATAKDRDRQTAGAHQIAKQLRAGNVDQVIGQLKRLSPTSPEVRKKLEDLIRYYSENAQRMHYDRYIRLGYGIGSGAVESAHKQVVHARLRQAGMRWSEMGARSLLALRLLLLNDDWKLLDRMRMTSLAA